MNDNYVSNHINNTYKIEGPTYALTPFLINNLNRGMWLVVNEQIDGFNHRIDPLLMNAPNATQLAETIREVK